MVRKAFHRQTLLWAPGVAKNIEKHLPNGECTLIEERGYESRLTIKGCWEVNMSVLIWEMGKVSR